MRKYLKLFDTHAEYLAFTTTSEFIKPNVSYCKDNNDVHYNPYEQEETKLVIKYNVTDASSPTTLINNTTNISENIVIDDTEISISSGTYQLSVGEHIVKFELIDNTTLGDFLFANCPAVSEAYVPNSVTSIGGHVFEGTNLIKATLGRNITYLDDSIFCSNAQHTDVYIHTVIPPTIYGSFCTNVTVYVPAESVNAYIAEEPDYASQFEPIPTT